MGLKRKFETGVFTVLAELDPPKGTNTDGIIANAKDCQEKIDAYLISEMNGAMMRMGPLGLASLLGNQGIPSLVEVSPCNRNRLALQGDLFAAQAVGAEAVLISHGTPPQFGDNFEGKLVEDLSFSDLLKTAVNLRKGQDLGDNPLDGSTDYLVGSALETVTSAAVLEAADLGADFVVSPGVFDTSSIADQVATCKERGIPFIARIVLLKSAGMARYLQQHMEGVTIPETVIERIRTASNSANECVAFAADLINELRDAGASGVLICTHGWENRLSDVMSRVTL